MEHPPPVFKNSLENIDKFEFFRTKDSRNLLFEASRGIAEYLEKNNISNLILADRSSRPIYIGVKEYYKSKYKDKKIPNIYFINPKGFKTVEGMNDKETEYISKHSKDENEYEEESKIRNEEDVINEFEQSYKGLLEEKDKPLVVFDTCSHSGNTLKYIKSAFDKLGFTNYNFLTFDPSDDTSSIQTESIKEKGGHCNFLGRDKSVMKTFEHVYSKKNNNKDDLEKSAHLRNEIAIVVNKYLNGEENLSYSESDKNNDSRIREFISEKMIQLKEEISELEKDYKVLVTKSIEINKNLNYDNPLEIQDYQSLEIEISNLNNKIKEKQKELKKWFL